MIARPHGAAFLTQCCQSSLGPRGLKFVHGTAPAGVWEVRAHTTIDLVIQLVTAPVTRLALVLGVRECVRSEPLGPAISECFEILQTEQQSLREPSDFLCGRRGLKFRLGAQSKGPVRFPGVDVRRYMAL